MKSDFKIFTVPNAPPGGDSTDFAKSRQIAQEQARQLEKQKRKEINKLTYLDIDMQCNQVKNDSAINQSIRNILLTEPGERIMLPEFGSGLKGYLFKGIDSRSAQRIIDSITFLINRWEPRVAIYKEQIKLTFYGEQNLLRIVVPYVILATGINSSFETVTGI